jgi:tetratricopeptide (TPR) repeat protein
MRFSRLSIIVLIAFTILSGASCSYYNKIIARKNLVDGATAYKERKFQVAEQLFRKAVDIDPNAKTMEGYTSQLFLARTLHSEFVADRKDTAKAQAAIDAYKKVLAANPEDQKNDPATAKQRAKEKQDSFKSVASLLETLDKKDESLQWITDRANNSSVDPQYRAEAYTSLAARQYSCANDISDVDPVKKTVKKRRKGRFSIYKTGK